MNPVLVFNVRSTVNCPPTGPLLTDGLAVNEIVLEGVRYEKPVKLPVPPGPVTATLPLADPGATTAEIFPSLTTIKLAAATPPNFTDVAPVKLDP